MLPVMYGHVEDCTAPHLYGKRYEADQAELLHHLAQALAELPARR